MTDMWVWRCGRCCWTGVRSPSLDQCPCCGDGSALTMLSTDNEDEVAT